MSARPPRTDASAAVDARVQSGDFDPGRQVARLGELRKAALASFVGRVEAGDEVQQVWIDHHAGLARPSLLAIGEAAAERWPLAGVILIHRHGWLKPCDRALFAAVASSSVEAAEQACAWLVDQVCAHAPFWRKDVLVGGAVRWFNAPTRWGAARGSAGPEGAEHRLRAELEGQTR